MQRRLVALAAVGTASFLIAASSIAQTATFGYSSFATAVAFDPPNGAWEDAGPNLGSLLNNGFAHYRSGAVFDLSALPLGAVVSSATLTAFFSNNPFEDCPASCVDRSIQLHGFAASGPLAPSDFGIDSLLASTIIGTGDFLVGFDVTPFVSGLTGTGSFAAFTWREEPFGPNSLMGISYTFGPELSIGYSVSAPIPEPEVYAMLLAGLGLLGVEARRRKNLQRAAA